ncbi:hypothetical protein ABIE21_003282 [Conyzicola nivalis]|uniref:Cthe-2314-like HEPN domain-containing protein n=1 Tax=Conyzicola nivalis TaxID=1477021 RepID=A0ABV2QRR0_9MICO
MIDEPYLPFFTSLVTGVAKDLVGSGELDVRNLSERDFIAALSSKLRDLQDAGAFEPVLVELDHLDTLLGRARAAAREDDFDYAIVFYATWVEHWLNMMIAWRAREDGSDDAAITELIRSTNFHAKTGSSWRSMFGEPLDDVGLLRDLGHLRNDFLHYKWQPFPVDDERRFDRKNHRSGYIAKVEAAVSRLVGVEDRLRYPGWTSVLEQWTVDSVHAAQRAPAVEVDTSPAP